MTAGLIAHLNAAETAPPKSLRIGGQEFVKRVAAESISVEELGPGGVSSMRFSIEDHASTATLAEGDWVEFWDITYEVPLFRGFIQALDIRFMAVGRSIEVTCIGIEVVLDWMLIGAPLTITAGTWIATAIQSLVAGSTGIGFALRAFTQPPGLEDAANELEYPIAGISAGWPTTQYDLTFEGGSLREAISTVVAACDTWVDGLGAVTSVDFWGGLRVFATSVGDEGIITAYTPYDYDSDNLWMEAGQLGASDINFSIDAAGAPHAVYVRGANAVSSGLVSDGSGVIGPVAELADDTITTAAMKRSAGVAYLAQMSGTVRGSYEVRYSEYGSPSLLYRGTHPGSNVNIEPPIVASEVTLTIMGIRKTFFPEEVYVFSFGGLDPSAVRAQRRQTRTARA